jgi:hypothetical protein
MTGAMPRPPANPQAPEVTVAANVQAAAGVATSVPVRIHHRGRVPASMRVTVLGLDSRWAPEPLDLGTFQPGEAAEITLTLVPERGALGARYPFVVAVEATPQRGAPEPVMGIAESTLAVDSAERISMSIQPPTPRAVFGKKFRVEITNPGSVDRPLQLFSESAAGASVRLGQDDVTVPAQRTVTVKGKVRIRRPTIMGGENTHAFTVTAQGTGAPEYAEATVRSGPVVRRGAAVAIGLVLVVALWAGLAVVFIPKISDAFKPKSLVGAPSTVTSTGPVASGAAGAPGSSGQGQNGGSGSGGNGSGSGSGSGAGGSGAGGGTGGAGGSSGAGSAQAGGYQLTGTITGPAARGTTVTLTPTSLLAASDEKVRSAPGASNDTVNALRSITSGAIGKVFGQAVTAPADESGAKKLVTKANGEFAIAGIQSPGYYLLSLAKAGFQTQRFLINSADLASPKPMKVALAPGNGSLSGTVTGPDGPIGAATITITDGTVSLQTSSVSASASANGAPGSWRADNLSTPGSYLVTATAPGYGGSSTLITLGPKGSKKADLTLKPGQASIVGTVSDGDGGLGGITVTATADKITRTATTVTSQSLRGSYILPSMPSPGEYTLTISGDGYLTQTRTVTLTEGVGSATVDATLSRADSAVTGTVTGLDAKGKSEGGLVGVGLTLTSSTTTLKTMTTSGDSAGSYQFTGVPPGTYVLTASQYGRTPASATIELKASDSKTVDLSLKSNVGSELPATSHIRGQVVDSRTGGPLTCDRTAVQIADKDCVATVTVTTPKDPTDPSKGNVTYTATSTAALSYVYTVPSLDDPDHAGLPPGLYTVTVKAPGYETTTTHVQVAQDQTAPAPSVSLPALGIISGTITTRVGTPAAPSCVVAVPQNVKVPSPLPISCTPNKTGTRCDVTGVGSVQCGVTSTGAAGQGAAGTYQIRGMVHGNYQVFVIAQDPEYRYVVNSPPIVDIDLGGDGQFDAVLDRLGRVQLTVYNANRQSGALSAAAGAALSVTDLKTHKRTPEGNTAADGTATITGLNGTYQVSATVGQTTASASSGAVGLNQTVSLTLVIAAPVGPVVGRIITNDGLSSDPVPVVNAKVTITGTIGFNGSTPVSGSVDVTTDAQGCYAIVPAGWKSGTTDLTTPDCSTPVTDAPSIATMLTVTGDGKTEPATLQTDRIGVAVAPVGKLTQSYPVTSAVITGSDDVRVIPTVSVLPQPVSVSELTLTIAGASGFSAPIPTDVNIAVQSKPGLAGGVSIKPAAGLTTTGDGYSLGLSFSDTNLPVPTGMPGRYGLLITLPNFVSVQADLVCDMGGGCTFMQPGTLIPMAGGVVLKQLPSISGSITVQALPLTASNTDGHPDWTTAVVNRVSGPTSLGNVSLAAAGSDPVNNTFTATVLFDGAPSVLAAAGGKYVFSVAVSGYATQTITVVCGSNYESAPASDGTQPASTAANGCTLLQPAGGALTQLPTFRGSLKLALPTGVTSPTLASAPVTISVTQQPNPSVTIKVTEAKDTNGNVIVNGDGTVTLNWQDSSLPPNLVGTGTYTLSISSPGFATRSVTVTCGTSGTCSPADNPVELSMLPLITGTIVVPVPLPSSIDAADTTVTLLSAPNGVGSANVTLDPPVAVPAGTDATSGQTGWAMTVHYTDPQYATVGGPPNLATAGNYAFSVALAGYGSQKVTVVCGANWQASPAGGTGTGAPVNGCTPLSMTLNPLPRFSGSVYLHQTLAGQPDTLTGTIATVTNQPAIKITVDASSGAMTWHDPTLPDGVVAAGSYTVAVSKPGYQTSDVHTVTVDKDTGKCTVDGGTAAANCALGVITLEMFPAAGGSVTADFLAPGATDLGLTGASVSVVSAPAGSGQLGVQLGNASGKSASLSWTDPNLPFPGMVLPGSYVLSITVPGYAKPSNVTVNCAAGGTCGPAVDLTRNPSFSGTLAVSPETPEPDRTKATFQVTGGPTGTGQITITSDSNGNLAWQESGQPAGLVRPGSYSVSASLTGYISKTVSFTCTSSPDTDGTGPTCSGNPLGITLNAPTTLKIALVAPDGTTAVNGAEITFQGNTVILAASSNTYTYQQSLSPTDSYTATVQAAGYQFVTVNKSSDNVTCDNGAKTPGLQLAPGGTTTCTIELTALGTISAQTNSSTPTSGNPIINQLGAVSVTARLLCAAKATSCPSTPSSSAVSFPGTSDSNGALRLTGTIDTQGLDAGTWYVTASRPGYVTKSGTVDINSSYQMVAGTHGTAWPISGGTLQLNLVPNKVTLQVHLQNQSGTDILPAGTVTISNSAVTVVCTINSGGTGKDGANNNCASNSDDYVTFAGIYPGSYDLAVSPSDTNLSQVRLTVQVNTGTDSDSSKNVQDISVSLASVASNLTGTVVDNTTDPATQLANATVFLSLSNVTPTPATGWSGGLLTTVTGTDGSFTIKGIADNSYYLIVQANGYQQYSQEVTTQASVNPNPSLDPVSPLRAHLSLALTLQSTANALTGTDPVDFSGATVQLIPVSSPGSAPPNTTLTTTTVTTTSPYVATFGSVPSGTWKAAITLQNGAQLLANTAGTTQFLVSPQFTVPDIGPAPDVTTFAQTALFSEGGATFTVSWPDNSCTTANAPSSQLPIVVKRHDGAASVTVNATISTASGTSTATTSMYLPAGNYDWYPDSTGLSSGWTGSPTKASPGAFTIGTSGTPSEGTVAVQNVAAGTLTPATAPITVSLKVDGTANSTVADGADVTATTGSGSTKQTLPAVTLANGAATLCAAPGKTWSVSLASADSTDNPYIALAAKSTGTLDADGTPVAFTGYSLRPTVTQASVPQLPDPQPTVDVAVYSGTPDTGTLVWSADAQTVPATGWPASTVTLIVAGGNYSMTADPNPDSAIFGDAPTATAQPGTDTAPATLAATLPYQAASVTVTVLQADGTSPAEGATVTLQSTGTACSSQQSQTDSNGKLVCTGLKPGTPYGFTATWTDSSATPKTFVGFGTVTTGAAGSTTGKLSITLTTGAALITVTNGTDPVKSASVKLYASTGVQVGGSVSTNGQGNAYFTGLDVTKAYYAIATTSTQSTALLSISPSAGTLATATGTLQDTASLSLSITAPVGTSGAQKGVAADVTIEAGGDNANIVQIGSGTANGSGALTVSGLPADTDVTISATWTDTSGTSNVDYSNPGVSATTGDPGTTNSSPVVVTLTKK